MSKKKMIIDHDEAVYYGLNAAILLSFIRDSIENKIDGIKYKHGCGWLVMSVNNIQKALPYLTKPKIRIALKMLEDNGAIIVECHNTDPTDTTKWYTVNSD
jgi:hypothetical protein